jgi:hypothetical protein
MRCVAALLLTAVQGGWQAAEIQHVPKAGKHRRSNLSIPFQCTVVKTTPSTIPQSPF